MQTIQTSKLSRSFGDFLAVDQLDLDINQGEIFGLLGPNAAGKSTTIRMLAGILQPTSGEAQILGLDLFKHAETIKHRIGYVAQNFALYPDLSVFENLKFYSGLYGVNQRARLEELITLYGLEPYRDRRAAFLSGGFKRRLSMACATSHEPEVLFLDEPTAGIDPLTRKELWDLFYQLANDGMTLLVTTHYMEEAERCQRLAFLSSGRMVAQGTPRQIRDALNDKQVYACELPHDPKLTHALMKTQGVVLVNQFGAELRIVTDEALQLEQLRDIISQYSNDAVQIMRVTPSIEDAFIALTRESHSG